MALTTFEFCSMNGDLRVPYALAAASEGIVPSGTAQATVAANDGHNVVRVATDTAVYVSFGDSPDASSDAARFFMPANSVEFFRINRSVKGSVVTI